MGMEDFRKRFYDLISNQFSVKDAYALLITQHDLLNTMPILEVASHYRAFRHSGIDTEKLDELLSKKIKGVESGRLSVLLQ